MLKQHRDLKENFTNRKKSEIVKKVVGIFSLLFSALFFSRRPCQRKLIVITPLPFSSTPNPTKMCWYKDIIHGQVLVQFSLVGEDATFSRHLKLISWLDNCALGTPLFSGYNSSSEQKRCMKSRDDSMYR